MQIFGYPVGLDQVENSICFGSSSTSLLVSGRPAFWSASLIHIEKDPDNEHKLIGQLLLTHDGSKLTFVVDKKLIRYQSRKYPLLHISK